MYGEGRVVKQNTIIDGKHVIVQIPEGEDPRYGIVIGPPDLSHLGLPHEVETRLNNELYVRGFITKKDVMKNRQEVMNAVLTAFTVTVDKIMESYNA